MMQGIHSASPISSRIEGNYWNRLVRDESSYGPCNILLPEDDCNEATLEATVNKLYDQSIRCMTSQHVV